MGWSESLPAFCAGTEIITDLANATLATNMRLLDVPHRLDGLSETSPDPVKLTTGISNSTCTSETNINFAIRAPKGGLKTELDFPQMSFLPKPKLS